jgi:DNA-binding NtrC family response regulator
MKDYAWPGNIRELKNAIQRALIFCEGEVLDLDLLNLDGPERPWVRREHSPATRKSRKKLSREEFISVIKTQGGNVYKIAQALEITRQGVYAILKRHGININDFRLTASG